VILSPEEVARLLDAAQSSSPGGLKYRAALSVAYGAGLRASEVVSLKLPDIDSKRMVIRVEPGKGRKDRYAMLSEPLLDLLRAWWPAAPPHPSRPAVASPEASPAPADRVRATRPVTAGVRQPFTQAVIRRRLTSKIKSSDGCGRDTALLAVERWYNFPEFGGYLGNLG